MLRITRTQSTPIPVYRLEGKLTGLWVQELATTLAEETTSKGAGDGKIELDLTNVAYVDAAGAHLLRSLITNGARITQKSDFVAALLETENP